MFFLLTCAKEVQTNLLVARRSEAYLVTQHVRGLDGLPRGYGTFFPTQRLPLKKEWLMEKEWLKTITLKNSPRELGRCTSLAASYMAYLLTSCPQDSLIPFRTNLSHEYKRNSDAD